MDKITVREDHYKATLYKLVNSFSTDELMYICAVFDTKSSCDIYDDIFNAIEHVIYDRISHEERNKKNE